MEIYLTGVALSFVSCLIFTLITQWWQGDDVTKKDLICILVLALASWIGVFISVICYIISICAYVLKVVCEWANSEDTTILKGRKKG